MSRTALDYTRKIYIRCTSTRGNDQVLLGWLQPDGLVIHSGKRIPEPLRSDMTIISEQDFGLLKRTPGWRLDVNALVFRGFNPRPAPDPDMYVLVNGVPERVRISRNGNLVGIGCGDNLTPLYGREGNEVGWPHIYRTEAEAEAAQHKIEKHCTHSWYMASHEERICRKCHAAEFIPDL